MTPAVSREDTAGKAYNDLRNIAKRNGRNPAEYFTIYAIEGFLVRLVENEYDGELVLKGGVLMTAFSERRPTRDIDFAAFGFPNNIEECRKIIRAIVSIRRDDGLLFDLENISGEVIRDGIDYPGVRVNLIAHLATASIRFHIDINFGDPIMPKPTPTSLSLLLGGEIEILAYPITMLLAEKTVTIIDRGTVNTRWRDFLDILRISENLTIDGNDFMLSIETVSAYRLVRLRPLAETLAGMDRIAQTKWSAWRKRNKLEDTSSEKFNDLLIKVEAFIDPAIKGAIRDRTWNHTIQSWS